MDMTLNQKSSRLNLFEDFFNVGMNLKMILDGKFKGYLEGNLEVIG